MVRHDVKESQVSYDDEIDLHELSRIVWRGRWIIAAVAASAAVVAAVVSLMMPNIYRAEALLAPTEQEGVGGMSSLAAQYGSIAALAGINLGGGSGVKSELALKVLESRQFLSEFVEKRDILVQLMASERWDPESGELVINSSVYDVEEERWVGRETSWRGPVPTMQEAHEEFLEILTVVKDRNSDFVTVSVEHVSPVVAEQWVDWLIEDLNLTLMTQDVAQAEQAIEYLNNEIAKTSLADLQRVFYNLIEEQTKIIMLARVSPEYVFRTVDPSVAPEERAKPNRVLIAILGFLLGTALGFFVVVLRESRRDSSLGS